MTRIVKKYHIDEPETASSQRLPRRSRTYKTLTSALNKQDRRHGWGYAKRRAILNED
jgi:hypothetical protein